MDVSPKQIVSVGTALIPFLEHDDANRALMGANMQKQAVPLVRAEAPYIGTGIEDRAARDAADLIQAAEDGEVTEVTGDTITVQYSTLGRKIYPLAEFRRSQPRHLHQPAAPGRRGPEGPGRTRSSPTVRRPMPVELALGKNLLVALMPWEGYNFEDAIILSERLVRDDCSRRSTSTERRSTPATPSSVPRRSPATSPTCPTTSSPTSTTATSSTSVPRSSPGDVLVGKVTPKGETELTPEERLLRAIFGERPARCATPA